MQSYEVIIIGAGAAGLMCAIECGKRQRRTLIIDHAKSAGEKIRISGGGRCNFTNLYTSANNFISQNPHFCISALKRFTQLDFIKMVEDYGITYHEKTLGQLFCDGSSRQIVDMLLRECALANVEIRLSTSVAKVTKTDEGFIINTPNEQVESKSLVIASGGLSIPKMGATGFGYDIAKQFDIKVVKQRAALVPFTLDDKMLASFKELSGLSLEVIVQCKHVKFKEGLLFTHKGLSGPAILQISSYWQEGDIITINLVPHLDILSELKVRKSTQPKQEIHNVLAQILPKRLAMVICNYYNLTGKLAEIPNRKLQEIAKLLQNWQIIPSGTEGYRTAEVTLGGIDTEEISATTFEAKKVPGLYFIGEVIDVTGHLGGFNFQWAWSSGFAAGQYA